MKLKCKTIVWPSVMRMKLAETIRYKKGTAAMFEHIRGILHRLYTNETGKGLKQLCVPAKMRGQVLSLAHDSILTGHLGMSETSARILAEFYWPGLTADVANYCRSCEACQRTMPKGEFQRLHYRACR